MKEFLITTPSDQLLEDINHKIDTKTKPLGALGKLEALARQVALIQQTVSPELKKPHLFVFAADHGIAKDGVSAYPQEVTFQMVMNFLAGGAAINVFARQNGIALKVVDAGVNFDFEPNEALVNAKVGHGTRSFLNDMAMSLSECEQAIVKGAELVSGVAATGCNVIGLGEMGIGNTSSAAMLMHVLTVTSLADCVGRGTGVDDAGLARKMTILNRALALHGKPEGALQTLATYGGFEIAMMCGAMLEAASQGMLVLVDGFIASSAMLTAMAINPAVRDYAVFCHRSEEKGHQLMLDYMDAKPLLDLGMRLGEGTGCAVAYPVVQSAVNFLNEMASFESAGVSDK